MHTRTGEYSHVYWWYRSKWARTGTYTHVQGRTARYSGRTGPNGQEQPRTHTSWGVQPGFRCVQAQRAWTRTYTHVKGRTARFPGLTGPNGHEGARSHTSRGVQPVFPGVQAQTGTNGHVHTCPWAYSQVSRANRPKRARTATCILALMSTARFSWHTSLNGIDRARTYSLGGVKPAFQGTQAQTA